MPNMKGFATAALAGAPTRVDADTTACASCEFFQRTRAKAKPR